MTGHVSEALRLLEDAQLETSADGEPTYCNDADTIAAAQVLATLELAEQQRLANLIAVSGTSSSRVPVEIREGLGL